MNTLLFDYEATLKFKYLIIASLAVILLIFVMLNLIFVVNKDDTRILREIFNIKKLPANIYKK